MNKIAKRTKIRLSLSKDIDGVLAKNEKRCSVIKMIDLE